MYLNLFNLIIRVSPFIPDLLLKGDRKKRDAENKIFLTLEQRLDIRYSVLKKFLRDQTSLFSTCFKQLSVTNQWEIDIFAGFGWKFVIIWENVFNK